MDPLDPDPGDPLAPDHPSPDALSPEDDGDAALEAALADPAFDDPALGDSSAVEDPGRPEDPFAEPGAPHLALDEEQEGGAGQASGARPPGPARARRS
jgi:hypothetical protein